MTYADNDDDKAARFGDRVKAAVLIFLIGSIVFIADHSVVAPSEPRFEPAASTANDEGAHPPSF